MNGTEFLVATTRPALAQRRLALAIVALLLVIFGSVAPFAAVQLPWFNSFVPAIAAVNLVANFTTAVLLFSQF